MHQVVHQGGRALLNEAMSHELCHPRERKEPNDDLGERVPVVADIWGHYLAAVRRCGVEDSDDDGIEDLRTISKLEQTITRKGPTPPNFSRTMQYAM